MRKTPKRADVKLLIAVPVFLVVLILDLITKAVAVSVLAPSGAPISVIGEWFRFALVYNPGAAFGLHLGEYSRWLFMVLTGVALVVLWRLLRQSAEGDVRRLLAIALVAAGAVGNVIDRIRSELGVVDFIDIGIGLHRWPTFNVADIAVSSGAFLLAIVLWREERDEVARAAADQATLATSSRSADIS
ncbi:lipoprotein signal peptidase [Gemmatimonas aurantiaca T-27]|uniref:Lipoprotein signal peptidase n=1 Tax=Gemmatimonas aurantiaca (strain DSM 14586 / JCM 11422 / NBRC 100505 / T-27) TaxID=379066 RepID=C1A883_GEMAT|nr:lipoprotein signal peptidase [Gemmatimonas aurantiaca T-27]